MIENILKYDDTWETVKKLGKPVFLYGMGDGADKVLTACERKGIEVSGVFASDGFAKRKLFHGFTVVPYSEVCEQNEDFTVLLSFASSLPDVIENINLCKCFTIICDNQEAICDFITNELHRSATVYKAEGAYEHNEKHVIITILKRSQAVELRRFIKANNPTAFIAITNSSEIIGKGFRGFN